MAYYVNTKVAQVEADSAAHAKGLTAGDVILEVRMLEAGKNADAPSQWSEPIKLWTETTADSGADNRKPEPQWAHVFYLFQIGDYHKVELFVRHADGKEVRIELDAQLDRTWPWCQPGTWPAQDQRGLLFPSQEKRVKKADDYLQALLMGLHRTKRVLVQVYLGLKSLVTGRLPVVPNLYGPISIVAQLSVSPAWICRTSSFSWA